MFKKKKKKKRLLTSVVNTSSITKACKHQKWVLKLRRSCSKGMEEEWKDRILRDLNSQSQELPKPKSWQRGRLF